MRFLIQYPQCQPCSFQLENSPLVLKQVVSHYIADEQTNHEQEKETAQPDTLQFHSAPLSEKQLLLISRIKEIVIDSVYSPHPEYAYNFSHFLSDQLKCDYVYLANLFSKNQGVTIEKFRIGHKVERVKKLLSSNEYTITMIAMNLHYSSVGHLSNQFKKTTGMSPTDFRKQTIAISSTELQPCD